MEVRVCWRINWGVPRKKRQPPELLSGPLQWLFLGWPESFVLEVSWWFCENAE